MKTDTPLSYLADIAVAFSLLTRLPVPKLPDAAFKNAARAVWAYPIVGAVLGMGAGFVGLVALWSGLPALIGAGFMLGFFACCTGAMHEDGLCDTADGFWGGYSRQKRLDIMKDSQIGTYGTLALILVSGVRWSAYATLLPIGIGAVVATAVVSRAALPVVMHLLAHARQSGLSHQVGRPSLPAVIAAVVIAGAVSMLAVGQLALVAVLVACLSCGAMVWLAHHKIGGQTGDVLGATQIISEACILCAFIIILA